MGYEAKAREILKSMTLSEKIGQMNLGLINKENLNDMLEAFKQGKYGAYLTYEDFSDQRDIHNKIMEASRKSRTGIPVLYGKDVIHGHFTVFPIGLGIAASFNPELIEKSFALIAEEARRILALHPCWILRSQMGPTPTLRRSCLTSRMAVGIWGLQGRNPADPGAGKILACPKHRVWGC